MVSPHEGTGRALVPAGGHAVATWTVPEDFGGMTSALLRRTRSLARELGVSVRILTFDANLDVARTTRRLRRSRLIVPGTSVHNVWEHLRSLPDSDLTSQTGPWRGERPPRGRRGELRRRERTDAGDHRMLVFRRDRTLAAVEEGRDGRSVIQTYTRTGRPGRRWQSMRDFYRAWIAVVLPDDPTYVVVDSKALIKFFAKRPGDHVRTLHLVHGAHLATDAVDAHGEVVGRRGKLLHLLAKFDAVVVLTPSQERDLRERLGPRVRTHVVPNGTELPAVTGLAGRDPLRGAMIAGLFANKQVDHAIAAVDAAQGRTGRRIELDVYGDGPEKDDLARRAASVPGVRLRGHVAGASSRFETSSFMLLTSRSEGMGLVLTEAMARGCLPIAYDIRYGPADIITHGVDGFLVPPDDVDALARTIEHVTGLDDSVLAPMRQAAVAAARRYDDAHVVDGWVGVMADVARRFEQRKA